MSQNGSTPTAKKRSAARLTASDVDPRSIERYQIELEKNPRSRIFAPLAESYRKLGLLDEAESVCRTGVQHHPEFASGHVAYAKVLIELKRFDQALFHLQRATSITPENLLAQKLLGEALLMVRRPKEALKVFKMVLLLNPDDESAQKHVKKWEFLTAEDFGDDVFAMHPVFKLHETESKKNALERAISLADSFTIRNDLDAALYILTEAKQSLGPRPEIETRLSRMAHHISQAENQLDSMAETLPIENKSKTDTITGPTSDHEKLRRTRVLMSLLDRIEQRRLGG